jgi:phage-related minor tail protein
MGDIINLRQARKVRARAEKAREAEANRLKFGRTKGERAAQSMEEERKNRSLDNARLDDQVDKVVE